MRNNILTRIIITTLLVAFLTISVGRVTPVSAMAVGPLADPVYDTDIIALYDYVSQNVDAPQLDIFFFLSGALAVAQLGAQDAKLISPYDSEENIQQWLINCGIQLYNSLIGLVPSGEYYVGVDYPTRGIKRDELKILVATLMGNAVLARNYNNLDDFLDDNPDQILINFNRDLQLGVNAVFGLNGGAENWQFNESDFLSSFTWKQENLSGTLYTEYLNKVAEMTMPHYFANSSDVFVSNLVIHVPYRFNFFINTTNHTVQLVPIGINTNSFYCPVVYANPYYNSVGTSSYYYYLRSFSYNPSSYNNYAEIVKAFISPTTSSNSLFYDNVLYSYPMISSLIDEYLAGPTYDTAQVVRNLDDLNYDIDNIQYYEQVTNDYLLDIRGLIGDLVNYVYVRNPVLDNLYDLTGNLVLPDLIKVSVDLEPITELLAPPIPVNLNDIAELTDNDYLERIKEHSRNFGETLGEWFVFWHNSDPEFVYVFFGSVIVILVGAFIGKWGHS